MVLIYWCIFVNNFHLNCFLEKMIKMYCCITSSLLHYKYNNNNLSLTDKKQISLLQEFLSQTNFLAKRVSLHGSKIPPQNKNVLLKLFFLRNSETIRNNYNQNPKQVLNRVKRLISPALENITSF